MKKYQFRCDWCTEIFEAKDLDEAIELAEEWILGEYDEAREILVDISRVWELDDGEEDIEFVTTIGVPVGKDVSIGAEAWY